MASITIKKRLSESSTPTRKESPKKKLLEAHMNLYAKKLRGQDGVTDYDLTTDSARLEAEGIPFEKIVAVRQKALDRFNREQRG